MEKKTGCGSSRWNKSCLMFFFIHLFIFIFVYGYPVCSQQVRRYVGAPRKLKADGTGCLFGHMAINTVVLQHGTRLSRDRAKITGSLGMATHTFL